MVNAASLGPTPDALLLDVRTPGEFAAEHIEGAVSLPLHALDEAAARATLPAGRPVVVVCRSGGRATMAAEKLAAWNLPASVLEGGMNAWTAAGLPVKRGRGVISLERQVRIVAGTLVLVGVLGGWLIYPAIFGLAAFVGAGLVFAGITDFCGMGLLLARMPWNRAPRA